MKKLLLPFLMASFLPTFVNAEYQVQYSKQQISGDSIKFVTLGNWLAIEPSISSWVNSGELVAH